MQKSLVLFHALPFILLFCIVYLVVVPVQQEGDGHTATTNITSLPHPITVLDNSSGKMEITICQLGSLS